MNNRLIHETSPYLLQHAHNPVDWNPWSPAALERARAEDKPILLSIGYSACHWCHVMERESFEDPATAAVMNEHFVNIKVDREERPDLDQTYQTAVQILGRHGGWPLTMFLTPGLKPFYGGTYFPPTERHGLPAFKRLLGDVASAYREQRDQIDRQADEIVGYLGEMESGESGRPEAATRASVKAAADGLVGRFDSEHGGFGGRPKFPNSMALELWLRHASRSGETAFLERALMNVRKMIEGGIYDQLGGGFHRYSTDARWLIPHFEKMLYDNGLLLRLVVQLYQATGDEQLATAARETADYVLREMTSPSGGFYSTQDADSEGEEGRFFAWTPDQLRALLGDADAQLVARVLGVSQDGNFEHGQSVLHRAEPLADAAAAIGRDAVEAQAALDRARTVLFEAREKRPHPARDEKIVTAWNGLMMQALAFAGAVLNEPRYVAAAARASDFIATQLWSSGTLLRTWRDGAAKIAAFAEDHAFVAEGELALFEATGDPRHFDRALALADLALELFWDTQAGVFFVTRAGGEAAIHRPRSNYDNAVPSATSSMVLVLLKLHALTGQGAYAEIAGRALGVAYRAMSKNVLGYTYLWCGADASVDGFATLVVAGPDGDPGRTALLAAARQAFAPNVVIVPWAPGTLASPALASLVEAKAGVAAYLCRGATCSAPLRRPEDVLAEIGRREAR